MFFAILAVLMCCLDINTCQLTLRAENHSPFLRNTFSVHWIHSSVAFRFLHLSVNIFHCYGMHVTVALLIYDVFLPSSLASFVLVSIRIGCRTRGFRTSEIGLRTDTVLGSSTVVFDIFISNWLSRGTCCFFILLVATDEALVVFVFDFDTNDSSLYLGEAGDICVTLDSDDSCLVVCGYVWAISFVCYPLKHGVCVALVVLMCCLDANTCKLILPQVAVDNQ